MSAYTVTHVQAEWHCQQTTSGDVSDRTIGLQYPELSGFSLNAQSRPPLRTHKSLPLVSSGQHLFVTRQTIHSGDTVASAPPSAEQATTGLLEDSHCTPLLGVSVPASPDSRLAPPSPAEEDSEKDPDSLEAILSASAEEEDESKPMTAAELRAQKRKMKRFRLTHNQTRFLMSEFARQAHPDAAHRDRLAMEIPGLSPRQVQVWFQNRRAKLKRLTTDDRERIMRSRALPDDFDMAHALHSPFSTNYHSLPVPWATSTTHSLPSFLEANAIHPLSLDGIRRFSGGVQISPSGIAAPSGAYSFTPPQSATDASSPGSAAGEQHPFAYRQSLENNPCRLSSFVGALPSPSSLAPYPQAPRLPIHDLTARSESETLYCPLRTSVSCGNGDTFGQAGYQGCQQTQSAAGGGRRVSPVGVPDTSLPRSMLHYDLGHTYSQSPELEVGVQQDMRSAHSTLPHCIELCSQSSRYQTSQANGSSSHQSTTTFPTYQNPSPDGPGAYLPSSPLTSGPQCISSSSLSSTSGYTDSYDHDNQYQMTPSFGAMEDLNHRCAS